MQSDDGNSLTVDNGLVRLGGAVGVYGSGRAFYKVENGSVSKISDNVEYAAACSSDGSTARWIWGADENSDPRVGVDDTNATTITEHGEKVTIVGDEFWGGPEGIWRGTPDSLTNLTYENEEESGEYGWYAKDGKLFHDGAEVVTPLAHVDAVQKYYSTDGWGEDYFIEWPDKSDPDWRKKWLRADFYVVVDLTAHEYVYMVDGQYMMQKSTDVFLERFDSRPPRFPNGMDHDAAGAVGKFKGNRIFFIGDRQFMTDASHSTELEYGNGPIPYPTMESYTWALPISKVVFQGNGEKSDVYGYSADDDEWYFPSFQNDGGSTGMKGADLRVYTGWMDYPCSEDGIYSWDSSGKFVVKYPIDVYSFSGEWLLGKTDSLIEHELYYMKNGDPSGEVTKFTGIPLVNRMVQREGSSSGIIARMADDTTWLIGYDDDPSTKMELTQLPSPVAITVNTDTFYQDMVVLENHEAWSIPYNHTQVPVKVSGMRSVDGTQWQPIGNDPSWAEGMLQLDNSWLSGRYDDGALFFLHFVSGDNGTLDIDQSYAASIADGFNDPNEYPKTTIHTNDTIEISRYTSTGRDALLFKRGSEIRGTRFITTSKPCETIYGYGEATKVFTQGQQFCPLRYWYDGSGAIPYNGSTVVDASRGAFARDESGTGYVPVEVAKLLPEKAPEKAVAVYTSSKLDSIKGRLVESSWVMLADFWDMIPGNFAAWGDQCVALLSPDRKICFLWNDAGTLKLRPVATDSLPEDALFSPDDKKPHRSRTIFVTGKSIGTLLVPFQSGFEAGAAAVKPLKISDDQIYAVNTDTFGGEVNSDGDFVPLNNSPIFASNSDGYLIKIYWTTYGGVTTFHMGTVSEHSGTWKKNGNIAWNDAGYAILGYNSGDHVEPKWTS